MNDPSDPLAIVNRHRKESVRRMVRSEMFWLGIAVMMILLGLIGRFGMTWFLWSAGCAIVIITVYGHLPTVQEKKRISWETSREELLEKWSLVVARLGKSSRERYNTLHLKVSRLGDLHSSPNTGSRLKPGEYLLWLYLKLLLARDLLEEGVVSSSETSILNERDRIQLDLDNGSMTDTSRQSKEETIHILNQRLDTARNRGARLQEIESDLTRIEQKLALMFDRAAQHNTMGDSGRRINFSDEIQTGASLNSLMGAQVEEMDSLVTQEVCA